MPSTTLLAGTPLWKPPVLPGATSADPNTELRVWHPEETDATCTVFAGVVCRQGEPITGKIPVVTTGQAYARVLGPVSPNDSIGFSATHDYLVKNGSPSCGKAMAEIADAEVKLVAVRLGLSEPGAVEFKRLRVIREGWAAIEGEDDLGNSVIALKPASILFACGIDDDYSYLFAGNELTATRETDLANWPEEEGFYLKVRNVSLPGNPAEYWHEVVWPPYIGNADSVVSGCRIRSSPPPDAYLVAIRGNYVLPGVAIDDVTLNYYDAGAPVGNSISPEWTDSNFDARRWTKWTALGNRLALDAGGLAVPNL